MQKKNILSFMIMAAIMTIFYSCKTNTDDLWENIYQLDNRITSLEKLCKQMNGDISSLQRLVQALQDNVCVTKVIPVKEGDKIIGYTISLQKVTLLLFIMEKKGNKVIKENREIKEIMVLFLLLA